MIGFSRVLKLRRDQEQRWRQGDRQLVESYLECQPSLRADREGILDLIYNEIVLRELMGEWPRLAEYLERFPELAVDLRLQFDVHRAIEEDPLTPVIPSADVEALPEETGCSFTLPLPQPVLRSGRILAGYEILEELGHGGMGVVYKARQIDLGRQVAVKVIRAGAHASAQERARFHAEARAVARLRHPNIIQIHQVGDWDGCPFFSMELVDGESLDKKFGGAGASPNESARLVETIARAMHHAHGHGIVHRDLKPSNVLLDADGVPKVTDFGLAKLLDASEHQTANGGLLGTPSYMAPEQASGQDQEIGPAIDVHALGAILYELLTGKVAFRGRTVAEILERVRQDEPAPPCRLATGIPRDLEIICLKCLQKDPHLRYATARDLAEDLRRFLGGEPIHARPSSSWERCAKWIKRRPALAGLWVLGVAAVASLCVFFLWHDLDRQAIAAQARSHEQEALGEARRTIERFSKARDDAVFHAIYANLFPDTDTADQVRRTAAAVDAALAIAGVSLESNTIVPVMDPHWSDAEKHTVEIGCHELLLFLAETISQPAANGRPEDCRDHARQALRLMDKASKLAPPTKSNHLRRARYLGWSGDPVEATQALNRAAALEPTDALDHFLLGDQLLRDGKPEAAAREFQSALLLQPKDFWSRYFLAVCYLQDGRFPAAEKLLAECLDLRPDFTWTYLLRASFRERSNRADAAEADYRQALGLDADNDGRFILLVNRGRMRLRQGATVDAVVDLQDAATLRPARYEPHFLLGQAYEKLAKAEKSAEELDCAQKLGLPPILLADYCYRCKRFRECLKACDAALAHSKSGSAIHGLRARALLQLKDFEQTVQAFDRYLAVGGKADADIYRGRGLAHLRLQDYQRAVDDFSAALQIEPTDDLYLQRGWAYFFADGWKLALRDFQEALERRPDTSEPHVGCGLALVMTCQYQDAVQHASAALTLDPDTPEMLHNIACVFAQAAKCVEMDATAHDPSSMANDYKQQAVKAIRQALTRLPPAKRATFWREKMFPDAALGPLHGWPEFERLRQELLDGGRT
jgi:tetratricopeptide (TPR) repeat protein